MWGGCCQYKKDKMRSSVVIVAILLGIAAYKLYTPVPDAIDEKLKFRAFVALPRIMEFVGSVIGLFNGKHALHNAQELAAAVLPHPPSVVEGSNIRSEVVTFDGVRVLLYTPIKRKSAEPVAGLMFFHGGGYMLGSPEMYNGLTRKIAEELDIVVASVDYRLSTEQPFPAAHEDCMTALRHFLTHTGQFGVDPARVGVAGDSAGGHLSAAVAQEASDDPALPPLRLQVLLYPLLQLLDMQTPSYQQYRFDFGPSGPVPRSMGGTFRSFLLLGRQDDDFIRAMLTNNHTSRAFKESHPAMYDHELVPRSLRRHRAYRGPVIDAGSDKMWNRYKHLLLDPRTSPLWREDLSKLPPAYIISCQYDGLRDDAVMYAARLEQAGVAVKFTNYHNGWHGMITAQFFHIGQRSLQHLIAHLRENL